MRQRERERGREREREERGRERNGGREREGEREKQREREREREKERDVFATNILTLDYCLLNFIFNFTARLLFRMTSFFWTIIFEDVKWQDRLCKYKGHALSQSTQVSWHSLSVSSHTSRSCVHIVT